MKTGPCGVHPLGEKVKGRTAWLVLKGLRGRGRRGALGSRSVAVDLLDEGADAARRLGAIAIACAVDFLSLERLDDQPYRASSLNRWYMGTALNRGPIQTATSLSLGAAPQAELPTNADGNMMAMLMHERRN